MRIVPAIAFGGFSLALSVAPLLAHHSTAALYDTSKTITIEGTVTRVEWLNPHAHLRLDVKNADATVSPWDLELASPNVLMKEGATRDFFKQGDQVSVILWRAKDGSPLGYPLTITFKDGRVINLPRVWMNSLNPAGNLRH
jgi:Family of unknown function (DUF6152)